MVRETRTSCVCRVEGRFPVGDAGCGHEGDIWASLGEETFAIRERAGLRTGVGSGVVGNRVASSGHKPVVDRGASAVRGVRRVPRWMVAVEITSDNRRAVVLYDGG